MNLENNWWSGQDANTVLESLGISVPDELPRKNARAVGGSNTVTLKIAKQAIGAEIPGPDLFRFEIRDASHYGMSTAWNRADGFVEFSLSNLPGPGIYDGFLAEVDGPPGWTIDPTEIPIQLEAIADPVGGGYFFNVTLFNPSGSGASTPAFVNVYESPTCGLIEFPEMTLNTLGDFRYTIKELTDDGNGWVTDHTEIEVIVHVTDDQYGNYHATLEYPQGFPTFVNVFVGSLARYTVTGCKSAFGGYLPKNYFTFSLTDSSGHVISTAHNTAADQRFSPHGDELIALSKQIKRAKLGKIVGDVVVSDCPPRAKKTRRRRVSQNEQNKCTGSIERRMSQLTGVPTKQEIDRMRGRAGVLNAADTAFATK